MQEVEWIGVCARTIISLICQPMLDRTPPGIQFLFPR